MTSRNCTKCGVRFFSPPTGGRPRSRCDACRSHHDRNDGRLWRELRAQVLDEEPICCVVGCNRRSVQVDHVIPLKLRPDLGLVRSNLRGICAHHNASKGARLTQGVEVDLDRSPASQSAGQPTRWVL